MTLGGGGVRDGEAQGFSEAADQVMEAVDYYIHRYGLQDKINEGKVKFWVSGFSRAGATADLTSKRIIEKYCENAGEGPLLCLCLCTKWCIQAHQGCNSP